MEFNDDMFINPNDDYFVLCDGEIVEPVNDGETINDYWIASEIVNYLQAVCKDKVFTVEKVQYKPSPCATDFYSVFLDGELIDGENIGFLHTLAFAENLTDILRTMNPSKFVLIQRAVIDTNNQITYENVM